MTEFALVAPVGFLLVLGAVVLAVIVLNQIQLSNAARDAARGAAICGSDTKTTSITELPDKSGLCTVANLNAYISKQMTVLHSCASCVTVAVYDTTGALVTGGSTPLDSTSVASCIKNGASGTPTPYLVRVHVSYAQPLYVPLVGYLLGNGGSNTRTISADVQATCEQ